MTFYILSYLILLITYICIKHAQLASAQAHHYLDRWRRDGNAIDAQFDSAYWAKDYDGMQEALDRQIISNKAYRLYFQSRGIL